MNPTSTPTRAIVIGGSVAGMLSARALADHFDTVTLIDRDHLPTDGSLRGGTPQARHLHTLLIRGERILERFFPGITAEMEAEGAIRAAWGLDNCFYTLGGPTPHFDAALSSHAMSRTALESLIRRRLLALPQISVMPRTRALGLVADADGSRIIGLRVENRDHGERGILHADLVVDASGRKSQAPQWLQDLGFPAPEESVITAHTGYASRWYRIPDHLPDDAVPQVAYAIQPRPDQGDFRGAGYMRTEGRRVVVTQLGGSRDYPPTDEAGFMAFMRGLPSQAVYDVVRQLEPDGPIYGYRGLENQMRHYERLTQRPENFLVMGDAAVAYNPIYGQGMASAAVHAELLDHTLRAYAPGQLQGLAADFQRRLARIAQGPWLISTNEDLRYPGVEGATPTRSARLAQRYFDLVAYAMPQDKVVTRAFFDAMNMLAPPAWAVMKPPIMARVLGHSLARRFRSRPAQPTPAREALR